MEAWKENIVTATIVNVNMDMVKMARVTRDVRDTDNFEPSDKNQDFKRAQRAAACG